MTKHIAGVEPLEEELIWAAMEAIAERMGVGLTAQMAQGYLRPTYEYPQHILDKAAKAVEAYQKDSIRIERWNKAIGDVVDK